MARPPAKYYPALDKSKTAGVRRCGLRDTPGEVQEGARPLLGPRVCLQTQWSSGTGFTNKQAGLITKCKVTHGGDVMGYAWAPQITGLVRGEPKPGQRHRSNGLAICMEAFEERASKSPTLDRALSYQNVYEHIYDTHKSGTDVWEEMCAEASLYRVPVKLRDGRIAERGLPHNAVIGWSMIMKPPPEMVAALGMETEDIARFCGDGFRAMEQIEPRLFRDDNVEGEAWHFDEGVLHPHRIGTAKDKNGKYCGNLIDARLCIRINQEWPALMRGMGWPIDDLDLTDWDRMKTDDDYREEREAKRKRQGQSVADYAKQRAAAAGEVAAGIVRNAKQTAAETTAQAEQTAQQIVTQANTKAEAALAAVRLKIQQEIDDAKEQLETDRKAAQAALQGDLATWGRLTPRPTATALLGVLGASVEASRTKPVSEGIGGAMEQLRRMMAARSDNPGPAPVEGPTR